MSDRLRGRVCLITGNTGMGAATARLAAAEGASVFVTGLEEAPSRSLAAVIEDLGWRTGDLRLESAAEAAVAACLERHGRIDGLFNVAGASGRPFGDGPLHECRLAAWEATLTANLTPAFLVTRAVLRHMLERGGGGSILHMASVLAGSPEPRRFATHAYAASKGAIEALTLSMAAWYAPHGIRVNALAPGLVRTPMSRRAQADAAAGDYIARKQPLAGGFIEAEDVARAAVFLLSDEARLITGEILAIDAGWRVTSV